MRKMASNKKINIPISNLSSDEICALLDTSDSDDEEDIENLMNELWYWICWPIISWEQRCTRGHATKEINQWRTFQSYPKKLPIEAVVRQAIPGEESDDDKLLSKLVKQKEPVWKWKMF